MNERLHIERFSASLNVPLIKKNYDPGFIEWLSRKTSTSLEGAARTCRYHFFSKIAEKSENPFFALGHNRNDQVETILMRLFQGSGLSGLEGIPAQRDCFIRPLLNISRSDIESYVCQSGISCITDSTNEEGDYRRNLIRRDLVPVLKAIFPDPEKSVLQFSRDIQSVRKFVESIHGKKEDSGWSCDIEKFFSLSARYPQRRTAAED